MNKHAHGEKTRRQEGINGQRRGIRERGKTSNVDEEAVKGNEKVLKNKEKALTGNGTAY